MSGGASSRLSAEQKAELLGRLSRQDARPSRPAVRPPARPRDGLSDLPHYQQLQVMRTASAALGIADPYFKVHEGRAGAETRIGERAYDNFSSYDYLGLNGHPAVAAAAREAIDRYGVSASASRLVAGERPLHQQLEARLARFHGAEACLAFVSGHATNVTVIGSLLGRGDFVLHDELIHNSVLQGAQLSGARRFGFEHNNVAAAEEMLKRHSAAAGRALIVIEGHYSMDGDLPDLPAFVDLARRYGAWLMVDEAHALGVVGATGRGVAEHFGVDPSEVDIWMGTLSKSLASCGGYIAGRAEIVDYLRVSAPGFVYSVGLSPPLAAAALAALEVLESEPERVRALNGAAGAFLASAKAAGLDTGRSQGFGIVPVITGGSIAAARLSQALFEAGVNVQPILYPAVPERSARLRFFLSCEHRSDQIERTVDLIRREWARIQVQPADLQALTRMFEAVEPAGLRRSGPGTA